MATHSSILAWRIPWTEEPGGLQSMGSQRVRHNWSNLTDTLRWKAKEDSVLTSVTERNRTTSSKNRGMLKVFFMFTRFMIKIFKRTIFSTQMVQLN